MVIQVGSSVSVEVENKKKTRKISYREVKYDEDGWVDANEFLPIPFDLCTLKTEEGQYKSGWYTGQGWDGQRIKEDEKITYWNRKQYDMPNSCLHD